PAVGPFSSSETSIQRNVVRLVPKANGSSGPENGVANDEPGDAGLRRHGLEPHVDGQRPPARHQTSQGAGRAEGIPADAQTPQGFFQAPPGRQPPQDPAPPRRGRRNARLGTLRIARSNATGGQPSSPPASHDRHRRLSPRRQAQLLPPR